MTVKEKCDPTPEFCPHASRAADLAVKKVFAILGVDVDDPKEVEEFRVNLRFIASMRKIADHSLLVFCGVIAVGLAAAVWTGITSRITGGH